jgi:site-specific recombinase XerD
METRLSILFFGKKTKNENDNLLSIYLRATINGERFEVSAQRYIEPSRWSQDAGKAKGTSEQARSINIHLDALRQKVYDYQQIMLSEGQVFTKEALRLKWYGLDERVHKLIEVFRQHNDQLKELVGREVAKETLVKFNTTLDHTVNFLQWKYHSSDIDIVKLDYAFLTDFEFYLKSRKKCNHNTTIKYLSNVRKIVNICIKNGWLVKDPFFGYKMCKKEVIREFLSEEELQNLINHDFHNDRLNQVRDIFVFSCFTGLAYVDAKRLKRSEIAAGVDGEKWIFTKRKKTDTPTRIPILPVVLEIIQRYEDHPQCENNGSLLPVPSNQKLNAYLKEIADIVGIKKYLTFHMARHTFATTVTLNNGVPIESVSKMLGHKSIKITQHYAKILDRKVSDDMQALKLKLQAV